VWRDKQLARAAKDGVQLTPYQIDLFPAYYNLVPVVLKAMQQAGTTTDTAAIAKAMKEVSTEGLAGTVTFGGTNQVIMSGSVDSYPTGSLSQRTRSIVAPQR
jgi:ABC-type branched-subunit amino acid transport system substrate-binding protein